MGVEQKQGKVAHRSFEKNSNRNTSCSMSVRHKMKLQVKKCLQYQQDIVEKELAD